MVSQIIETVIRRPSGAIIKRIIGLNNFVAIRIESPYDITTIWVSNGKFCSAGYGYYDLSIKPYYTFYGCIEIGDEEQRIRKMMLGKAKDIYEVIDYASLIRPTVKQFDYPLWKKP